MDHATLASLQNAIEGTGISAEFTECLFYPAPDPSDAPLVERTVIFTAGNIKSLPQA